MCFPWPVEVWVYSRGGIPRLFIPSTDPQRISAAPFSLRVQGNSANQTLTWNVKSSTNCQPAATSNTAEARRDQRAGNTTLRHAAAPSCESLRASSCLTFSERTLPQVRECIPCLPWDVPTGEMPHLLFPRHLSLPFLPFPASMRTHRTNTPECAPSLRAIGSWGGGPCVHISSPLVLFVFGRVTPYLDIGPSPNSQCGGVQRYRVTSPPT